MQPVEAADVVRGIFATPDLAQEALVELRALGFVDAEEPDFVIPDHVHHHVLDRGFSEMVSGVVSGALVGAVVGMLAGVALVWLAVPSLGGGTLYHSLLGVYAGILFGGYLGSIVGMGMRLWSIEDLERRFSLPLKGRAVLVVVLARRRAASARAILRRYGAAEFVSGAIPRAV